MTFKYFAYGSNLVVERITERIGKVKLLGTSSIRGWEMLFNKLGKDGTGKCNLNRLASATVYGALYEISASQKYELDAHERGYRTISLFLPNFGQSITYISAASPRRDVPNPYDWYKKLVVTGAKKHHLPVKYLSKLESVQIIIDTDFKRRTENLKVLN